MNDDKSEIIEHEVQLYRMSNKQGNHNFETFLALQDLETGKYYFIDNTRPFLSWLLTPLKNHFIYYAYEVDENIINQNVILFDHKWTNEEADELRKSTNTGGLIALAIAVGAIFQAIIAYIGVLITSFLPVTENMNTNGIILILIIFSTFIVTTLFSNFNKRIHIVYYRRKFKISKKEMIRLQGRIFGISIWTHMKWYFVILIFWLLLFYNTGQSEKQVYVYGVILTVIFTFLAVLFTDWRGPTWAQKINYLGRKLPTQKIRIWRHK